MAAAVRAGSIGVAALFTLATASNAPAQTPPSLGVGQKAGYVEGSILQHVTRARLAALEKLRSADCLRVFSEFQDLEGRHLDEVLAERKETAQERLMRIAFRDGSQDPYCGKSDLFAFTSPGSLTVFICPAFRSMAERDSKAAANILIHEELHSLGAGEAPMPRLPSSRGITIRVQRRCGQ